MNGSRLLVIGDENAVFGFALLGVEGRTVRTAEEARQALHEALARPEVAIVLLTEDWADALRDEVERLKATTLHPLIVEVPASRPGVERPTLRQLVQRALGVRIEA